eukprot:436484-Rhodomonas_salina.2
MRSLTWGMVEPGTWHRGQRHGFGELTVLGDASIYSGEWNEDKKEGYGVKLWCKTGNVWLLLARRCSQCSHAWWKCSSIELQQRHICRRSHCERMEDEPP